MAARGRKSAASLELPSPSKIEVVARPDAPYDLSNEESEEWWAVVNRMPADWFGREAQAMISQYCRHVVSSRRVAEMLIALNKEVSEKVKADKSKSVGILLSSAKAMDRLLKMQERESRAIASLATKLRISPQATINKRGNKTPDAKEIWDDVG